MKEIILGRETEIITIPMPVEVEGKPYFILQNDGGYLLVSRKCPHMGHTVVAEKDRLICHLHEWTFDPKTGVCLEFEHGKLDSYPVIVKEGILTTCFTEET